MKRIRFEDETIDFNEWKASGKDWRERLEKERRRLRSQFDTREYERQDLSWYHTAFLEYFVFAYDTSVYDRENGNYRIEELLDQGKTEFAGYDFILFWHAYPRLGIDERNQFDFFRDMPGGLEGLKELVARAHRRGVRVFIPYLPWDKGTRREAKSDVEMLAEIVGKLDVDGICLDTMNAPLSGLRQALDKVKPGVVLSPELCPPLMHSAGVCTGSILSFKRRNSLLPIEYNGFGHYKLAKKVLIIKWIEPRFSIQGSPIQNAVYKNPAIANSFFHGMGQNMLENSVGWWNPFTAEDRTILRRCIHLLRAHQDAFLDPDWQPYVDTLIEGVFAHRWHKGEKTVYTLFNSTGLTTQGEVINVPFKKGMKVYDAWNGTEAKAEPGPDGTVKVYLPIDPLSCSCLIIQPENWPSPVSANLPPLEDKPSYHRVTSSSHLPRPVIASEPGSTSECPEDMVLVKGGSFLMRVHMELSAPQGGCYSYPERQGHPDRMLKMKSFFMDRCEVTNSQYQKFLMETHYRPRVMKNFLKHWIKPEGEDSEPYLWQIPEGKENHPVVYVDLNDARFYARWAKKRLATEEEWQYAAQGNDGRKWPWGDEYDETRCNGIDGTRGRKNDIEGSFGQTTPVDAYPKGASPFGCLDMSGNVWEWTESERDDGHTRYAILRGGCHFRAGGSRWYVSGGAQPCDRHVKMLLLYPGLDRCSTIGFRCVKDLEE